MSAPTATDIAMYGEDADDVAYLRSLGGRYRFVARFRDGYRINRDFVTSDELRRLAAEERAKRKPTKAAAIARAVARKTIERMERTAVPAEKPTAAPRVPQWQQRREALKARLAAGDTIKQAAAVVGVHYVTATKVARELGADRPACGCGRPGGHSGRCWFRLGKPAPGPKSATEQGTLADRMARLEARVAALEAQLSPAGGHR